MSGFPIDIVLPWVDGSDESWQSLKNEYLGNCQSDESGCQARYRDMGTLKYWFRALEKNAPWLNRVFLVTWGHIPEWLSTEHPKLRIIKHSDYIPEKYLPTFNSHTIELCLGRIEDLSEHFVYMNDDTFLVGSVASDYYFSKGGLPVQSMIIRCQDNYNPGSDMPYIEYNNMGLINRNFRPVKYTAGKLFNPSYGTKTMLRNLVLPLSFVYPGFYQDHMPAPLLKSTFEKIWDKEGEYLDKTCSHRFRDHRDVNQWLVKDWQLAEDCFLPCDHRKMQKMIVLGEDDVDLIALVSDGRIKELCINDNDQLEDVEEFAMLSGRIVSALNQLFPEKSSFEKE